MANEFTVQIGPNPETLDPALNSAVDGGNMLITLFETLLIIGLIYLCITYPLSKLVGWFEKKMSDDSGSGKKRIKHATYESGDLEGVGGGGEPNADLKATHTARDVTVRGRLGGFGLKK